MYVFKMAAEGIVDDCDDRFCNLCRINYTEIKLHVYSKKHRATIEKIQDRFLAKIKEAKSSMKHPYVSVPGFESSIKIWCYYCELEVVKHFKSLEKNFTVCNGGFLAHLNSKDHLKNCKKFWWTNRIDVSKMNAYVLSDDTFASFTTNASAAVADFEKQEFLVHQQIVTSIRQVTEERQLIVQHAHLGESESDTGSQSLKQPSSSQSSKINQSGVKVLPPWMQPDDEVPGTSRDIGPDIQDYQRHLAQEKRKKLPPNRVGANFDRDAANTADWLPSFGRVWNSGRRAASKKEFDRQSRPHHRRKNWSDKHEFRPYQPKPKAANVQKYVL